MLKLYCDKQASMLGQNVESWDRAWEHESIEEAVRFAEIAPLKPIFDRYLPRGGRILEGGCGRRNM